MSIIWYVDGESYPVQVEPVEIEDMFALADDRLVYGKDLFVGKKTALMAARERIDKRLRWLYKEEVSSREYGRILDWLQATRERIEVELRYGEVITDAQMYAEMRERQAERGNVD